METQEHIALWDIKKLLSSTDIEDNDIGRQWLYQVIGHLNAQANLYIMTFYKDWENDCECVIDDRNSWKMIFNTYPTNFGKDYRYKVTMIARYNDEEMLKIVRDYSRWHVGNNDPKWDFCQALCDLFRKQGIKFYNELFT